MKLKMGRDISRIYDNGFHRLNVHLAYVTAQCSLHTRSSLLEVQQSALQGTFLPMRFRTAYAIADSTTEIWEYKNKGLDAGQLDDYCISLKRQ